MREQALVGFVAKAQDQAIAGEQQRPEKKRSFLPRPEDSKLVGQRQVAIAVVKDVSDREIVVEGGAAEDDCRNEHGAEAGNSGPAGGFTQRCSARFSDQRDQTSDKRISG